MMRKPQHKTVVIPYSCDRLDSVGVNMKHFDLLSQPVFCKDLNSRYIYVNDNASELTEESTLGLTDYESPWSILADEYQRSDQYALEYGCSEQVSPFIYNGEVRSALVKKTLLRDSSDNVIGIFGMSQFIDASVGVTRINNKINEIPLDSKHAKMLFCGLTTRESEVLYLLLRGFSARKIASTLGLAETTVVGYIDNIKCRYGVQSKSELIQKAIGMGYIFFIPKRFLGVTALK